VQKCRAYLAEKNKKHIPIEVEARTLEEVKELLSLAPVDRVLLDNMVTVQSLPDGSIKVDTSLLESALKLLDGRIPAEASGNVTLQTVPFIAATGVDFISSGALTHSVMALDISLKIKEVTSTQ